MYVITAHDPRHDTPDEVAELVAWENAFQARVNRAMGYQPWIADTTWELRI